MIVPQEHFAFEKVFTKGIGPDIFEYESLRDCPVYYKKYLCLGSRSFLKEGALYALLLIPHMQQLVYHYR